MIFTASKIISQMWKWMNNTCKSLQQSDSGVVLKLMSCDQMTENMNWIIFFNSLIISHLSAVPLDCIPLRHVMVDLWHWARISSGPAGTRFTLKFLFLNDQKCTNLLWRLSGEVSRGRYQKKSRTKLNFKSICDVLILLNAYFYA